MTAQDLKNSILQQAIQGKLLPQNPADEPASELLKKISAERQKLIDEGKIKNPPQLPPISDAEKPFDIPESWQWVKIKDLAMVNTGLTYKKSNLEIISSNMVRVLRGGNIGNTQLFIKDDDVMISRKFVPDKYFLKSGDLITPSVTSLECIGKTALICRDSNDMVAGGFVFSIRPYFWEHNFAKYFLYFFNSKFHKDCCKSILRKSGQALYNLSKENFSAILIPLPPLAEQKRIVEKLEEILPLVERYGELEQRLTKLDKEFPDKLKKSLLQQAIQGKLTEQLTTDGDAKDLLEKIREEKSKLISEGKIKKEKPLPTISAEEIPFDIPENWKWVRLGEIGYFVSGYTPKNDELNTSGKVPYFKVSDMNSKGNEFWLSETNFYLKGDCIKKFYEKNTIVYPKNGGAIFTNKRRILKQDSVIDLNTGGYKIIGDTNLMYVFNYFLTIDFKFCYKGTALPTIDSKQLRGRLFPLPPLAEQKRIVERQEELLPLCDRLKEKFSLM